VLKIISKQQEFDAQELDTKFQQLTSKELVDLFNL